MTKTQHKRTAVASVFQNGISQNTKCAKRDSFHREGHICYTMWLAMGVYNAPCSLITQFLRYSSPLIIQTVLSQIPQSKYL